MRLVFLLALAFATGAQAFVLPSTLHRSIVPARAAPSMTVLVVNGKKIDAPAGSNLGKAIEKAGFKPNYSCRKGECNSCVVSVGGTRMKACVDKVPPQPKVGAQTAAGLAGRVAGLAHAHTLLVPLGPIVPSLCFVVLCPGCVPSLVIRLPLPTVEVPPGEGFGCALMTHRHCCQRQLELRVRRPPSLRPRCIGAQEASSWPHCATIAHSRQPQ
jgi:ferredoxin